MFALARVLTIAMIFQLAPSLGHSQALVSSPYLGQVVPLLPADAVIQSVLPGSTLSDRIDGLTLKILATPSGRVFCKAVDDNLLLIHRAFFINERFARKGQRICQEAMSSAGSPAKKFVPFPKKFFVVETHENDFVADGWTTPRNETFLFLNKMEMTDERLIRSLTHELAVSFDGKEVFGFAGLADLGGLGIQDDLNSCVVAPIVRRGLVKHTLSALRAFDIERKVAEELRLPLPARFANWSGRRCSEKIIFMASHVEKLSRSIAPEELFNSLMDYNSCSRLSDKISSIKEVAELLEETTLTFSNGTQVSACEYFTDGKNFEPGLSFRGGPGPRIGGGGW